ncbi:MAG: type II toxin-antitoxin system HicB family antitoxin, partial [Candidatus Acidiferrum sp.]
HNLRTPPGGGYNTTKSFQPLATTLDEFQTLATKAALARPRNVIPSGARNLLFKALARIERFHLSYTIWTHMNFDDYEQILYQQDDGSGWVAEIPVLEACYALMKTPDEAKAELKLVFDMIMEERSEQKNA